jgi:hypothetical protein
MITCFLKEWQIANSLFQNHHFGDMVCPVIDNLRATSGSPILRWVALRSALMDWTIVMVETEEFKRWIETHCTPI